MVRTQAGMEKKEGNLNLGKKSERRTWSKEAVDQKRVGKKKSAISRTGSSKLSLASGPEATPPHRLSRANQKIKSEKNRRDNAIWVSGREVKRKLKRAMYCIKNRAEKNDQGAEVSARTHQSCAPT